MKRHVKRYDRQFKLEAVRLIEESDRPMYKIALNAKNPKRINNPNHDN